MRSASTRATDITHYAKLFIWRCNAIHYKVDKIAKSSLLSMSNICNGRSFSRGPGPRKIASDIG